MGSEILPGFAGIALSLEVEVDTEVAKLSKVSRVVVLFRFEAEDEEGVSGCVFALNIETRAFFEVVVSSIVGVSFFFLVLCLVSRPAEPDIAKL